MVLLYFDICFAFSIWKWVGWRWWGWSKEKNDKVSKKQGGNPIKETLSAYRRYLKSYTN